MLNADKTILIVDDDPEVAASHERIVREMGYATLTESDPEAVEGRIEGAPSVSLVLLDIRMPRLNGLELLMRIRVRWPTIGVVIVTVVDDVEFAVQATKRGAYNYLLKPLKPERAARVLESWFGSRGGAQLDDTDFRGFVTGSPQFRPIFDRVRSFAAADVSVLVTGETGTGKELIAERVHALSPRRAGRFLPVNVCALTPTLFESELLGHRAGAFTGATTEHIGYCGAAAGGTLFLDEIGDLAPETQVKLLRLLQSRRYTRVGETEERTLEARVVMTTNRDLQAAVAAGKFREDLFYRMSSHWIHLPPLRERPGDIEMLAGYFVEKYSCQYGRRVRGVEPEAMACLLRHGWSGNVRELEGMISGAVLVERGPQLTLDSLPEHARIVPGSAQEVATKRYVAVMEALASCQGNQTKAAQKLGVNRVTFNKWLKQYRESTGKA